MARGQRAKRSGERLQNDVGRPVPDGDAHGAIEAAGGVCDSSEVSTELTLPVSCLTSEEANFVYNVEILGLPAKKAADLAGMLYSRMSEGHVIQARELTKRESRGAMALTKEEVVFG